MALVQYRNEYSPLKRLALYRPAPDEIEQTDANAAMYIDIPDPTKVLIEFDGIVEKLKSLGIEVVVLEPSKEMPKTSNMIFLRDVAFPFRDQIVLANMKYPLRRNEPKKFKELLQAQHVMANDMFVDLDGLLTMEGADIFVINEDLLYVYAGNRTSEKTSLALERVFPNVRTKLIDANITGVPQHILGGVHILTDRLAARRVQYCTDSIEGFDFIDFQESLETKNSFSLNILTLAPGEILMPAGNPLTKKRLEENGIICHEVEINEIHKMGGGIACMVLPLYREV